MTLGDVLIVDDSPLALEIMGDLLEARGLSVRKASGGRQALCLVQDRPPDLVLLDVHMPDLDGFEVCRRLRERWPAPALPVMFLSAASDPKDKVRAFALGGVDFVTKPFQLDEVLARIDSHLAFKRVQQEALERAEQLEKLNAQLNHVEQSRRRVLEAVVHDLKNPLTPVLKNTEWLLDQEGLDAESMDVLRDVYVAATHMHRMVLSLLDVARSEEGSLELRPQPVPLNEWFEQTLALTRLQLRSNPERLVATVSGGAAPFDPAMLSRVVQNLLDNALKYSPAANPVLVTAGLTPGGGLRVVVEDSGRGVPPQDRERIFEPWARVKQEDDAAVARASHGLGLAFCKRAVTAHGGTIRVEPVEPTGSRFVVELPGPG
jgi:signal transduction histidine kinase